MTVHFNVVTGKLRHFWELVSESGNYHVTKQGRIVPKFFLYPQVYDDFRAASLDLNFAKKKTLKDQASGNNPITFSRASSGTYVDSDGLIKTSPVNLKPYSEEANTYVASEVTVTANQFAAPDGTFTADRVDITSANSLHYLIVGKVVTGAISSTTSVYVKAISNVTQVQLSANITSGRASAVFDLVNVTAEDAATGNVIFTDSSITSVGNGWYRISLSYTTSGGTPVGVRVLFTEGNADALDNRNGQTFVGTNESVAVWGVQVEKGLVLNDYIPTGATISGAPRFDHDPVTGESLGLLIEEERTNLIKYSSDLSQYHWNKTGISVTAVQESNPFNYTDVYRVRGTGAGSHELRPNVNNFSANTTSTFSAFAAADGTGADAGLIQLRIFNLGHTSAIVNFDLNAGTANAADGLSGTTVHGRTWTISDYGLEPYGNGWYRVWMTAQVSSIGNAAFVCINSINADDVGSVYSYTASGNGGFLIAGIQVEAGSFKTSAIHTSGSTVTRSPDITSIEGNKFAKTNLLEYSERFDQWGQDGVVKTNPNAALAPDGTPTADLITVDPGGPNRVSASGLSSGSKFTFSFYFKNVDIDKFAVRVYRSGADAVINFNATTLAQLSTSNIATANVVDASDGWKRIIFRYTNSLNTGFSNVRVGGATSGSSQAGSFYLWGAQVEEGDELTEYTPSVETFVSRTSGTGYGSTYVDDATGLIKTTPVNLFRYSQEFTAGTWQTTGGTLSTEPIPGPFDTSTVYKWQANTAPSFILQDVSTSLLLQNEEYTQSIYAKAGSRNFIQMAPSTGFPSTRVNFELTGDGAVGVNDTGGTASIEKIGSNGWYRIKLTITRVGTPSNNKSRIAISVASSLTAGRLSTSTGNVHIWGAQIEEGTTATPYIKTGSTISGAARYENGELLLEPARTNVINNNTFHYNSIWSNLVPSGAYNNAGIAPDGTNTAFAATAYAPAVRGQKNYSMTADTNDYTFSIFIKSTGGQGKYITYKTGFNIGDQDTINQVAYDFATDTVGHGYSRKLYSNGWVRIWKTYTNTNKTVFLITNLNTTSLDMLFWGAQLEQGSYPSSLIITPDFADVTRAADVSTSALGVDSWYNQSEGTVFIKTKVDRTVDEGGTSLWYVGSDNRCFYRASGDIGTNTATQSLTFHNTDGVTTSTKTAIAIKANDHAGSNSNDILRTAPGSPTSASGSSFLIGHATSSLPYLNGHISRLAYFPTRKTNQELIKLTDGSLDIPIITYGITSAGGTFDLRSTGAVNYAVDWDSSGGYEQSTSNALAHTYTAGDYDLVVYSGDVYRPFFNNVTADVSQITSVVIATGAQIGDSLEDAWHGASNMTSFVCPFDVTSGVTNLSYAWKGCSSLTSFPLITTSRVNNFQSTWQGCLAMTVFPSLDFSSATKILSAWNDTRLTSFPRFDFPLVTEASGAWRNINTLTSFPANTTFPECTNFTNTWRGCSSLTAFPALSFPKAVVFKGAWSGCTNLATFDSGVFDDTGTLVPSAFDVTFSNCALTAQSIENILVSLDANGASNITLGVGGGTNAAKTTWSTDANTAYDNLIAKGWTINFNA